LAAVARRKSLEQDDIATSRVLEAVVLLRQLQGLAQAIVRGEPEKEGLQLPPPISAIGRKFEEFN
jgi:hypothetical protein